MHRFFAPSMDPGDETVTLPREEAEHLTRVLRLGVGDTVAVFDGRGREFLARVAGAVRRDVRVQLISRVEPAAEPAVPLTLVQAILKGEKMDEVVRDAVMLGVAAIQPIVTKRTEVTVAALIKGARLDRWRRVALASVKQSRRAVVPDIRTPLTLETYLDEPPAAVRLMLVEPRTSAASSSPGTPEPYRHCVEHRCPRMRRCWSAPRGDGPKRSLKPRMNRASASSRSGTARCAPTRSRSPRSACCSFSGVICNAKPIPTRPRYRVATLKSCVLMSPSPIEIRMAPERCCSRNAGSNHSPCTAGSTIAM